jgi:hypothetical protein
MAAIQVKISPPLTILELVDLNIFLFAEEQGADPKELKRKRDRERYARNKDEISKKRREARELKKNSSSNLDAKQTPSNTPVSISPGTSIRLQTVSSLDNDGITSHISLVLC